MELYTVKSGQNIYDVAVTLYGSVEGVFDLLISNTTSIDGGPLTLTTILEAGMVLKYHTEFVINKDITSWLEDNKVSVKNGEGNYVFYNPLNMVIRHLYTFHNDEYVDLTTNYTATDQIAKWRKMSRPRIVIKQQGNYSAIKTLLYPGCHMIIDWGDNTSLQVIEDDKGEDLEHQYDDSESHTIILYGDFTCIYLDFSELNGIHYCVDNIYVDKFADNIKNQTLNALIQTI